YEAVMLDAVRKATELVYKRFDTLVDTLLGEDWKSRKEGKETLLELFTQRLPMTAATRHRLEQWGEDGPGGLVGRTGSGGSVSMSWPVMSTSAPAYHVR